MIRLKRKKWTRVGTKPRAAPVLRSRGTVTRRTAGKAERAKSKKSSRSLPSGKLATNNSAVSMLRPPALGFFGSPAGGLPGGARSAEAVAIMSQDSILHKFARVRGAFGLVACFSSEMAAK